LEARHSPKIGYLDGNRFQLAIIAGCKQVIKHEKELNKLNVFPIPDQDTGSNLKKTLMPLVDKFPYPEPNIDLVSQKIADLAVQSALGYSGIIFSQIFLGLSEALKTHLTIRPDDLKTIVSSAKQKAYQSVENPVEGTILSVLRAWSEEVIRICSQLNDFVPILETSYQRAVSALKKTPDQLEVLRKNNVVDAGGKAFVYFLEGIHDYVKIGKRMKLKSDRIFVRETPSEDKAPAPFCVECCVKADRLNRKDLIEQLGLIGQDLIFYGARHFAQFHINTPNPEDVFACASLFGTISSKKIFPFSSDPSNDQQKESLCLVADSTCDLMDEMIEQYPVYFVPIKVQAGDHIYTDRWDLIPEEFYSLMETPHAFPKTSQPSLGDFTRSYQHLLMHYQSIISIHLSKALSGTFQTAVQASQSVSPERITVIDGKNVSVGLGLVLVEAIKAIEHKKSPEETVLRIKEAALNTHMFIGLPTLRYLVKGGRVTKTKGIIAHLLNINPILTISVEGKLVPVSKARGKKNIEKQIFNLIDQKKQKMTGEISFAVAHTNAPELGEHISQRIKKDFERGTGAVPMMNASPVLGAHAGPGAYGIAIHDHSFKTSEDTLND
jgi:DegV family protein with EDD domain